MFLASLLSLFYAKKILPWNYKKTIHKLLWSFQKEKKRGFCFEEVNLNRALINYISLSGFLSSDNNVKMHLKPNHVQKSILVSKTIAFYCLNLFMLF